MKSKYKIVERYLPDYYFPQYRVKKKVFGMWFKVHSHFSLNDCKDYVERHERANQKEVEIKY